GLAASERVALRKTLRELERAGDIARIRKNRYVLPAEADLVAGKLSIHQAGYGFLLPEKSGDPDIFIAAENIGTAMHGDRVVARISRDTPADRIKGRREGRVIRILERARDTIVRKYHLPAEFPKGVLDQAERISEKIGSRQLESREDLRKEFIVTIDPDDARDFDDAIQVEKTSTGWRLGVHIADVATYVEPASA